MRIARRRGQYMSVEVFLADQRRRHEPARFHDDSTVSDFLRGPATTGHVPPAPSLEDYDRDTEPNTGGPQQ
jgi:hypothetical protein